MSENARIYCFSGTGNAMFVSQYLAARIGGADIVSVRCEPEDYPADTQERVGFVFPQYFGGIPGRMQTFIRRLRINPNAYVFAVACCGYDHVYALYEFGQLMERKHISPAYYGVCHTVATCGAVLPTVPQNPLTQRRITASIAAVGDAVAAFAGNWLPIPSRMRKKRYAEWQRLRETYFDAPEKRLSVADGCTGCGACEKLCHQAAIRMEAGKPVFLPVCNLCLGCVSLCPERAILLDGKPMKPTRSVGAALSDMTRDMQPAVTL